MLGSCRRQRRLQAAHRECTFAREFLTKFQPERIRKITENRHRHFLTFWLLFLNSSPAFLQLMNSFSHPVPATQARPQRTISPPPQRHTARATRLLRRGSSRANNRCSFARSTVRR